eukprot:SAG31_NODE_6096_length_2172_cov_1.708635_2_plen_73_part_00
MSKNFLNLTGTSWYSGTVVSKKNSANVKYFEVLNLDLQLIITYSEYQSIVVLFINLNVMHRRTDMERNSYSY